MKKRANVTKKQRQEKELKMQSEMLIAFYRKNLVLFVERELGVKLNKWQKILLSLVQRGVDNYGK